MMAVLPGYRCTETELTVYDFGKFRPTEAWAASMDWLRFHDIDPTLVPCEATIVRDIERCRVVYPECVLGEDGRVLIQNSELVIRTAYSQGEAPPLPWPAELTSTEPSAEGAME